MPSSTLNDACFRSRIALRGGDDEAPFFQAVAHDGRGRTSVEDGAETRRTFFCSFRRTRSAERHLNYTIQLLTKSLRASHAYTLSEPQ